MCASYEGEGVEARGRKGEREMKYGIYNPLSISPSTTNQRMTSDPGIIHLSYLDDCHGLLQGEGGLEPLGQLDGLLLCDLVVTGMARPQLLHPTGVELRSAIHLLKAS